MQPDQLSSEEIAQIRRFFETQKIRKKKEVVYSQVMDGRDPNAWANLYTEDALAEWGKYGTYRGREAIRNQLQYLLDRKQFEGFHMTTNFWIELTGEDSATSRCYLQDILFDLPANHSPVVEYGIYEEDWVKVDGDWQIKHHRIFFLWPIREDVAGDEFATRMVPTPLA